MSRPLLAAALLLLARPAGAQDPFGVLGDLFSSVNSIGFYGQLGVLQTDAQVSGDLGDFAMGGVGVELLLALPSTTNTEFELGLGASMLTGIEATEPTLDLHTSIRTLPYAAVYAEGLGVDADSPIDPYVGLSFGIAELLNARGYDAAGNVYPVEGETFELGVTAGLYMDRPLRGLYVEIGYRNRNFSSVAWDTEALPENWPRAINASTWQATVGWQFRLRDGGAGAGEE